MVERKISGIKRSTTAIEGTYRHFLTTTRIISHFKREADKKIIMELVKDNSNMNNLLLSTAAIHLYYNMGIRVFDTVQENNKFTFETTKDSEDQQKKILMEEFKLILKNSFNLEIDLLYKIIDLENLFISHLIKLEGNDTTESKKEELRKSLDLNLEKLLLDIINHYPSFYFYDFIGDLIGFTDIVKQEILENSSSFKDISIDLEKKLEREEKEDNFIELSCLDRIIRRIRETFEFKSHKELKVQAMPIRMIKKRIIKNESERFPISVKALKVFISANEIKRKIVGLVDECFKQDLDYDEFENKILDFIKSSLIEQLTNSPNDFVYFLESLNESGFEDIIYLINQLGIYDLLNIMGISTELIESVRRNITRYNIQKSDILALQKDNNLLYKTKAILCDLKFPFLRKLLETEDIDLSNLINKDDPQYQKLWNIIEERLGFNINDLREFIRKKHIIEKVFFQELKLVNYNQILLLLNFEEIFHKLVRDIYLFILTKILRQFSRIIELYDKITNDKGLFLLALKKIDGTLDSEEWVRIKFEELIIKRIIDRQEELSIVFDATNQVFLVNGFILALLLNKSLKASIEAIRTQPSYMYSKIKPLVLKADLISPISYCIAYDLLKRFEDANLKNKKKAKKVIEEEQKERQEKRKEIRNKQEENTFNWIERKITSSIMGISRPGINPNLFYWDKKKDTRVLTEYIKIFVESGENISERFLKFYMDTIELMRKLEPKFKLPESDQLSTEVNNLINETLLNRLKHKPTSIEINSMLDGEIFSIANQISIKIGKLLDRLLYFRFKKKRKNG